MGVFRRCGFERYERFIYQAVWSLPVLSELLLRRVAALGVTTERAGTANLFMFTEPLACSERRDSRTKVDWAWELARLLAGRYAACPKVIVVCDHLNTHTKGAFYKV